MIELRQDLRVEHTRRQRILQRIAQVIVALGRDNQVLIALNVIRIINPERGMHDWQIDHKFDARGSAHPEIRMRRERQVARQRAGGKGLLEGLESGLVQFQLIPAEYADRAGIQEKVHAEIRPNDGNAIFEIGDGFRIAAGESDRIAEGRDVDGQDAGIPVAVKLSRIGIADARRTGDGDKGDGRNRLHIKAADRGFATRIKALKRRRLNAAIAGDKGSEEMNADRIPLVIRGDEMLEIHRSGDGACVAAQSLKTRTKRKFRSRVWIHRVADGVVKNARRDLALADPGERRWTVQALELQRLEQCLRRIAKSFDVRVRVTVR